MSLSPCDDAMTFNHFVGLCENLYHMDEPIVEIKYTSYTCVC